MRNLYTPYRTPPGCHDVPFIYLFDGNDLTNGIDIFNQLSVKMDSDSQFILRRIAGTQSIADFFSYRNADSSYVWQPPAWTRGMNAAFGNSNQGDIGVLPEKFYPDNGLIRFDLGTVDKAVALSGGTDFLAYIAFQGAKRFPYDVQEPACPYRPRGKQYVLDIPTVTWTRGQYKRFSVKIDGGYDFELLRLNQLDNGTTIPPSGGGIPVPAANRVGVFNYMLYDPHKFQLMSAPVPDSYIIDQINGIAAGDPSPCPGVFPCPGMLYPSQSQIIVDLYAVQSTPQGSQWQIVFDGMERIPR
jgi:hypothetical protein